MGLAFISPVASGEFSSFYPRIRGRFSSGSFYILDDLVTQESELRSKRDYQL